MNGGQGQFGQGNRGNNNNNRNLIRCLAAAENERRSQIPFNARPMAVNYEIGFNYATIAEHRRHQQARLLESTPPAASLPCRR